MDFFMLNKSWYHHIEWKKDINLSQEQTTRNWMQLALITVYIWLLIIIESPKWGGNTFSF